MFKPLFLLLFLVCSYEALNVTVISPSRLVFDSYNAEISFSFSNYDIPIVNRRTSYINIGWCNKMAEKIKDYNITKDQYLILTRLRADSPLCEDYWPYNTNIVIALPDSLKPRSRVTLHYTDGKVFYEGFWDEFARYLFDKTRSAQLDYDENRRASKMTHVGVVRSSSALSALRQTDKKDISRYFSSAILVSIALLGVVATVVLMLFKNFPSTRATDKVGSMEDKDPSPAEESPKEEAPAVAQEPAAEAALSDNNV